MSKRNLAVLLLIVVVALAVIAQPVLFEDGSVQFFNHLGWGFCLLPEWGC